MGWKNHLTNHEPTKDLGESRMAICKTCKIYFENHCSTRLNDLAVKDFVYNNEERHAGFFYAGCGCYLPAKVVSPKSQCPIGKW